jgi:hypothetical protein
MRPMAGTREKIRQAGRGAISRMASSAVSRDVTLLEMFLGALSFAWGFWVALPNFHALYYGGPAANAMWRAIPEGLWGYTFLLGGALQFLCANTLRFPLRRLAAFFAFISWLFLATFRIAVLPQSPNVLLDMVVVFAEALVFIRLPQRDRRAQ